MHKSKLTYGILSMETNRLHAFLKQHYLFCSLVGISIFLFFFELGGRSFEIKDARRFAEITQEMMQGGSWLILHKHGETYMNKPPMLMWLIALFSSIGDQVTPLTARLPSAIAGLSSILVIYYFTQRFLNQRTAFIAAIILATSQRYFWYGRSAFPDMLFTLFVALALLFFCLGYKQNKEFYIGTHLSMFFAIMTKGPLGIIFILGIIVVYLAFKRDLKAFKELKWRWGSMLIMLIIGLCILYCIKVGFEPFMATIKREFLTRMNKPVNNSEPFYYYFVSIWTDFLPWSLFIPFASIYAHKKWRVGEEYLRFIFCWAVFVFAFLCVAKAKHPRYMLPLYPALSILVAALIDDTLKGSVIHPSWVRSSVRWIILSMAGLTAILIIVAPAYFFKYSWAGIVLSLVMLLVVIKVFLLLRRKNEPVRVYFTVCMLTAVIGWGIYVHSLTVHSRNETFGTKLTYAIKKDLGDLNTYNICGYKLGGSLWNIVNLNLKMHVPMIKSIEELKTFMNAPDHQPICIIEKKVFEEIKDHVLDDTLNTLDVSTKKRQVTLIFKRNPQTDSMHPAFFEIPHVID
ncbi:MAG: glycosyltransferase family 39 protein [Candidatus Brocadia sp.]|nr:glycosyltransferase family 39 protein [Candidatus Brocadia sp.]